MDLTKITNKETKDLKLNESDFNNIKTFIITGDKDTLPVEDVELNSAIDAMLNRWKVPEGANRDKLKKLCVKLQHKRLNEKQPRIFWHVLRDNINDISEKEVLI